MRALDVVALVRRGALGVGALRTLSAFRTVRATRALGVTSRGAAFAHTFEPRFATLGEIRAALLAARQHSFEGLFAFAFGR